MERVETELGSGLERHSEVKDQDLVISNRVCERARLSIHRFQNCWSGHAVKECTLGLLDQGQVSRSERNSFVWRDVDFKLKAFLSHIRSDVTSLGLRCENSLPTSSIEESRPPWVLSRTMTAVSP